MAIRKDEQQHGRRMKPTDEKEWDYPDLVGESAHSSGATEVEAGEEVLQPTAPPGAGTAGVHEKGLSVPPEELGRAFLQDATEARGTVADDSTEVSVEEIAAEQEPATDHERRLSPLPSHESDDSDTLFPAFDAALVVAVVARDEALFGLWEAAVERGQVGAVEVNGQPYAVVKDSKLARHIVGLAPELDGYLYDQRGEQVIIEQDYA